MSDLSTRLTLLHEALRQRILILDGGMGTMIQSYKLSEADSAASASSTGTGISKATTTC